MNIAIQNLRQQIQALEHTAWVKPRAFVSSSMGELDAVLPQNGLPLGTFVELIQEDSGFGAFALALQLARSVMATRPAWVVVDSEKTFHPPAAAALGCTLEHLALLRPDPNDAGWAFAQVLKSIDVGACFWASANMDNTLFRRLQLSAERGGGLGFVIRPAAALRKPCWSGLRLKIRRDPDQSRLCVTILHAQGGYTFQKTEVIVPLFASKGAA